MRKNRGLRRLQTAAIRVEHAVARLNAARQELAADVAVIRAYEERHRRRSEWMRKVTPLRVSAVVFALALVALWLAR